MPRCTALNRLGEPCKAARMVRPIAELRASNHEVVALCLGLKSEDATGSWISPASEGIHDATFSQR